MNRLHPILALIAFFAASIAPLSASAQMSSTGQMHTNRNTAHAQRHHRSHRKHHKHVKSVSHHK